MEGGEIPETKEASLTHPNVIWIGSTLESAKNNNGESCRVFQRICEMLAAPARARISARIIPDS